MASLSVLILDILAIIIIAILGIGIILGIVGIILKIMNVHDIKKGKEVSKFRKILTLIFCICGLISFIIVAAFSFLYFLR